MGTIKIHSVTTPPSVPHTHTVVFLHGRGDSATKFQLSLSLWAFWIDSQGRSLHEIFPSFRWVFPQAPAGRCASSLKKGFQWFDVWNVKDLSDKEELQADGLKEVVPGISRLLADEAALLGGRWDRIVLAGINTGAVTSLHVLFNLNVPAEAGGRLGAFLGFSCQCPFTGRSLSEMRKVLDLKDVPEHSDIILQTPMLLEHCVDDPVVLIENGRDVRNTLRGFGAQVEWKEYPNGGYWLNSPAGLDDVVDFLNRKFLGGRDDESTPPAQHSDEISNQNVE